MRDRVKSKTITSELEVTPIMKKIKHCGKNWRRHIKRMKKTNLLIEGA